MKKSFILFFIIWGISQSVHAASGGITPDVLGIKVGASSLADARTALQRVSPALKIWEVKGQLLGEATAGRGISKRIEIQNGEYVSFMKGITRRFTDQPGMSAQENCGGAGPGGFCESLIVKLTAPPDAGTVIQVQRAMSFEGGPSVDNMMRSLSEKYGQPGLIDNYSGRGTSYTIVWAWRANGASVPIKNLDHPCANREPNLAAVTGAAQNAASMMQNGCATVVHVRLSAENGVVKFARVFAANAATAHEAAIKTSRFVGQATGQFEMRERDKSNRVNTPKL